MDLHAPIRAIVGALRERDTALFAKAQRVAASAPRLRIIREALVNALDRALFAFKSEPRACWSSRNCGRVVSD